MGNSPLSSTLGIDRRALAAELLISHAAEAVLSLEDAAGTSADLDEALDSLRAQTLRIEGEAGERKVFVDWHARDAEGRWFAGVHLESALAPLLPDTGSERSLPTLVDYRQRSERAAQRSRAMREVLAATVAEDFDEGRALEVLCRAALSVCGADGACFWSLQDGEWVAVARAGRWSIPLGRRLARLGDLPAATYGELNRMRRAGKQLFANDLRSGPLADAPLVAELGLLAGMGMPVDTAETPFGLLTLGHTSNPFAFDAVSQFGAEELTRYAALLLERSRAVRRQRAQARFARAMNRVALELHGELDLAKALGVLCRESCRLFGAQTSVVLLRELGGFREQASWGRSDDAPCWELPLVGAEASVGGAFLNDFEAASPPGWAERLRAAGVDGAKHLLLLPLEGPDGANLGLLVVFSATEEGRFCQESLERGRLLARQGARAVWNAQLYKQLRETRRVIARQDRATLLGELALVITHELNSTLLPLRTLVELLPHRYDDAEFRDWYSETVLAEVERMQNLVGQLGRFRPGGEREEEECTPAELVESVVELLRPEIKTRRIELEVDFETADPLSVFAAEIHQALLSLMLNAMQAVGEKGWIRIGARAREGGGARFFVEDSGPGVAPQDRDRIFESFYTTKPSGMGLGLAVAREILDAHGGTISLERRAEGGGGGATFVIDLPA